MTARRSTGRSTSRVSTDELVSRLAGRWTCPKCGAVYHEVNQPPKQAGVCDNCGSTLAQRDDDKPGPIRKRIEVHLANLEPLVEYYRGRGRLVEIDGAGDPDAVTRDVERSLEG